MRYRRSRPENRRRNSSAAAGRCRFKKSTKSILFAVPIVKIRCGSYRSSRPARQSKRFWSTSIFGIREITTRPPKIARILPNSSTPIRTLKSRNTTIGTESLPAPPKKIEIRDRHRTAARNGPFSIISRLFPTFSESFLIHRHLLPIHVHIRRLPSARARPPPLHVAAEGGRGRTGDNRKARCSSVDKKRVPIFERRGRPDGESLTNIWSRCFSFP